MSEHNTVVQSTFDAMKDTLHHEGLSHFKTWLGRVIEFTLEVEPDFTPDLSLIKNLWEFGAPAGSASDDCIAAYRQRKQRL